MAALALTGPAAFHYTWCGGGRPPSHLCGRVRKGLGVQRVELEQSFEKRLNEAVVSTARAGLRHWLLFVNLVIAVFAGLPMLAPFLMLWGYSGPASAIYILYRAACHQLPQRSFFIGGPQTTYSEGALSQVTSTFPLNNYLGAPELGFKMAWCERDVAIFLSILLAGLVFALLRRRLPALPFSVYLLLLIPMVVDGGTQVAGWRESTWLLRLLTGFLFGVGTVWLVYPYLDEATSQATVDLPPLPARDA